MLGAVRQELIFARHQAQAGRPPGWLGVPLLLTSHTWVNAKNEQSHQDPTMAESLLAEMATISRVVYPPAAYAAATPPAHPYDHRAPVTTLRSPQPPPHHPLPPPHPTSLDNPHPTSHSPAPTTTPH